jgi:23S rRNA (uracil1939-C5)-methyltransferase
MAQRAAQVIGVEGAQALVDQARHNALINGIDNTQFHVADLAESAQSAAWANERYSHVLIDPPRSGAQAVLALIARTGAEKLVYVSCNPATLARDAGALVHQHGFRLVEAGIADMFPHTAHVESIAFFERVR